jgi:hypothetical protein
MIKNESLGDRLNDFKNNKNSTTENIPKNSVVESLSAIFLALYTVYKVLIFGYSTKIIFNTDWNFWKVACIGIAINLLMSFVSELFYNNKS